MPTTPPDEVRIVIAPGILVDQDEFVFIWARTGRPALTIAGRILRRTVGGTPPRSLISAASWLRSTLTGIPRSADRDEQLQGRSDLRDASGLELPAVVR